MPLDRAASHIVDQKACLYRLAALVAAPSACTQEIVRYGPFRRLRHNQSGRSSGRRRSRPADSLFMRPDIQPAQDAGKTAIGVADGATSQ